MERELSITHSSQRTSGCILDLACDSRINRFGNPIIVFIGISFLLHFVLILVYRPNQRTVSTEDVVSLSVTLQTSQQQAHSSSLYRSDKVPQSPVVDSTTLSAPPPVTAYELLQQSDAFVEQQLQLEKHQADWHQFKIPNRMTNKGIADRLLNETENSHGEFTIEEFPLADGNTFVKLTYANGKTLCFDIREADPFDPFSIGVWRFSRCK